MSDKARKLEMIGVVTSDKMDKTVVVTVERQEMHPVFKKFIRRRATLLSTRAAPTSSSPPSAVRASSPAT